jgi:ribosomal protein S18 acetylase RimI-like enzyme
MGQNKTMANVTLRTTTAEEYEQLLVVLSEDYARQQTLSGKEMTYAQARKETERLLPDGPRTANNLVLTALDGDQPVGSIWIIVKPAEGPRGWINSLWVNAECRGKGYGKALMVAAEQVAAEHGLTTLGLNVFAHNTVAVKLYDELGYEVTAQQMSKTL